MKTVKNYNIYIFISTFTRNIIDVYSIIYLYKIGFSIRDIFFIYALIYFSGAFISKISIALGNRIGYKYILMASSILSGITFYIMHTLTNLYIISLSLSLSAFTYHPIRHYFGIRLLNDKKDIGNNLIYIYIAMILSSYMAIFDISIYYLIIISFIGIIPALFIYNIDKENTSYNLAIPKNKINFFIFDQFKVIFILLQPLYLYLIASNISYVGTFNIILSISSIVCIYVLSRLVNINKYYKYINIILTLILLLKLNINNKVILLLLAFFEGIGIKSNDLISTMNLYNGKVLNRDYLVKSEMFICMVRALILSIIYFLSFNLKTTLYILLIGIFILSFQYKKDTN